MKYIKVRGILKALKGLQIPKFYLGGNPYFVASSIPTSMMDDGNINWLDESNLVSSPKVDLSAMSDPKINPFNTNLPSNLTKLPAGFKPSFGDKMKYSMKAFGNLIGNFSMKNPNLVAAGIDALGGLFNKGVTNNSGTNTAFAIGDTVANGLMAVNPALGLAGKGVMAALKGVNSLGGKRTQEFSADTATIELIGGSYGGSVADINNAVDKAGKKYGLFSSGSRRRADRQINEARRQQNIMTGITNEASDMYAMAGNDINYLGYLNTTLGGYDLRYMRAAKSGMKIDATINLIKSRKFKLIVNVNTKLVEELQEGGSITTPEIILEWEPIFDAVLEFQDGGEINWEPIFEELQEGGKLGFDDWFNSIPENYRANGYDYKKAYEVFSWEELANHAKDPENNHLNSVSPIADENGNYPFLKLGKIEDNPEIQGEFDWYNSEDGKEHKSKFDIEYINDRYYYVPKKFKDGGKTKESDIPEIEETTLKNIIPEGALHKNKHHIENTEGLTLKGIPVVDNEGQLLAEIEKEEWTMTLELTKTIESLYNQFYSEGVTLSDKDQLAISAGKILVELILYNTDDRAKLLNKIKI